MQTVRVAPAPDDAVAGAADDLSVLKMPHATTSNVKEPRTDERREVWETPSPSFKRNAVLEALPTEFVPSVDEKVEVSPAEPPATKAGKTSSWRAAFTASPAADPTTGKTSSWRARFAASPAAEPLPTLGAAGGRRSSAVGVRRRSSFSSSFMADLSAADGEPSGTKQLAAQEELWKLCEKKMMESAQYPMKVIEFDRFVTHGEIPKSSAGLEELRQPWQQVIFISHRWWDPHNSRPDDPDSPIKHGIIVRGVRLLAKAHKLDEGEIALWMDFGSIDQDDPRNQRAGIDSLLTYAMRSDYVLIPVYPCLKDSRVLQTAVHPYDLVNYGERAWCRLEIFVFGCVASLKQVDVKCYACGMRFSRFLKDDSQIEGRTKLDGTVARAGCLPRKSDSVLRRLFGGSTAWFSQKLRPSSGDLTDESDRELVAGLEENVRQFFSTFHILLETGRFQREHHQIAGSARDSKQDASSSLKRLLTKSPSSMMRTLGPHSSTNREDLASPTSEGRSLKWNAEVVAASMAFSAKMISCSNIGLLCSHLANPLVTSRLTSLSLRLNLLKARGIGELCNKYICTTHGALLRALDVGENQLGPEGGAVVAEAISSPHFCVTKLALSSNDLGETVIDIIRACTTTGKSLEMLDLQSNEITTQIATSLVSLYSKDQAAGADTRAGAVRIRNIDLGKNRLRDPGALAVGRLVCSRWNGSVEWVSLAENAISDQGGQAVIIKADEFEKKTSRKVNFEFAGNLLTTEFWQHQNMMVSGLL